LSEQHIRNYIFAPQISGILKNLKKTHKMKKLLALLMIAGMFSVVACGPSAEEKAKMEEAAKAAADSAAAAAQAAADQAAAAAASAAATVDSAAGAMVDSAAAMVK